MDSRRSPHVAGLALTVKPAGRVGTHRIRPARLRKTFVDVHAYRTFGVKSVFTETLAFGAFRVGGTVEVGFAQNRHVDLQRPRLDEYTIRQARGADVQFNYLFAGDFRIRFAGKPLRTKAVVSRTGVLAHGVETARFTQNFALVDV